MANAIRQNIWVIFLIGVVIMVAPIAYIALHSVPAADDFFNARVVSKLVEDHNGSFLLAALSSMWDSYFELSGYYFGLFVNHFFTPFLRSGVIGVRVFNFLACLFFVVAFFMLTRSIVKALISDNRNLVWGAFFAASFCLINNYGYREMYSWYCTMAGYIIPIAVSFLMVSFYFAALRTGKTRYVVLAAVSGFLASGSGLNIVVLNCGLAVVLLIVGIRDYKSTRISVLITTIIVVGALINVVAPGNFVRHDAMSADYNIMATLVASIRHVVSRLVYLASSTPSIVVAIILVLVFYNKLDANRTIKCSGIRLLGAAVLFFVGAVLVVFPVVLGYSNEHYPDRALFVQDVSIVVLAMIWFGLLAVYLKTKAPSLELSKEFYAAVAISCLLFCCILPTVRGISEWTTPRMWSSIAKGAVPAFADYELDLLDEIENSPDSDVVIHRPEQLVDFMVNLGLKDDPEYWVNVAIAQYYGKDSVVLDPPEGVSE